MTEKKNNSYLFVIYDNIYTGFQTWLSMKSKTNLQIEKMNQSIDTAYGALMPSKAPCAVHSKTPIPSVTYQAQWLHSNYHCADKVTVL